MRLSRRYAGTFFFFPALLPLAAMLPWLLTALGGVAALASFSLPKFWRRFRMPILMLALAALAAGGGVYMWQRPPQQLLDDGSRAGVLPAAPVVASVPAVPAQAYDKFAPLWHVALEEQILSSPVIVGDMVLYGLYDKGVAAIARADGARAWTVPVKNPVFAIAADADGVLYAGEGLHETTSSALYAIRVADGVPLWTREFFGHLEGEATVDAAGERIWVSAGPGGLWSLSAADGAVLWHAPLGHIDARGFLHGKKFYIPANTDEKNDKTFLFALDAATGRTLWQVPQPGKPWGSPVVARDGKTILTNTGDGQIGVPRDTDKGWAHAVTTEGKAVWQAELPDMALQPSVYIPRLDLFIHTTKDGQITALRVADGGVAWQVDAGDEFQAPAAIVFDDGNVALLAALDFKGRLTVLNAATGAVHFTAQSGPESAAQSTSSPIAAGDVMYVADAYGITAYGGLAALARASQ